MKAEVTIYRNGEIDQQFKVVGFQKAVSVAMKHLCLFLDAHVAEEELDAVVKCIYLAHSQWSCTVTFDDRDIFGLNVRRAS